MHVLLIHQAFASPNEPGGTRHFELASFLAAQGHRVTVIASATSYLTHANSGAPLYEVIDGVAVHRIPAEREVNGRDFSGRLESQLRFAWSAYRLALDVADVDLVLGTSPPMFQAAAARAVAMRRRIPFALEIRDLWPAFAIEMGVLRRRWMIRAAEWLERRLYADANVIIVNSPGFIDHVASRGVDPAGIHVVSNGVDVRMFDPASTGDAWRERLAGGASTLVVYTGALGAANGLDTVLDAGHRLRDRRDIGIVLVGDGSDADRARRRAEEMGLRGVRFLGPVPKSAMKDVLAASDVCIATLRPLRLFGTTYPNKIFDYLAAGRPIVSDIQGPIAAVIERAGAGFTVPAGDSDALAAAIVRLADDPALRRRMGVAGRQHVVQEFDRRVQAREFQRILEETLEAYRSWDARRVQRLVKRGIDVVVAATALAVLSPVLLALAGLIALRLGRPVVFAQQRIGLAGRPFRMLKFRSMTDDRDHSNTLLPDDQRLVPFGAWLRRWSLDELLQFVNVFKGEMSLVGPRPLPETYRTRYSRMQWRRHYVRPGITGWAQINGRNAVEWDARFEYDLWYSSNWSVLFDLRILMITVSRVLRRVGINQPGRATMTEFMGSASAASAGSGARAAIFLSVRDKATRLPGKVLADIHGTPALVRLVRRLKAAAEPELVVLTTSVHPDDAELIEIGRREGIEVFAGSEEDKLQRYLDAAREFGVDVAVVVDGDDLLVSVEHIDEAIRILREGTTDFVSQTGLPLGAASFGIRIDTLASIVADKAATDTEVWGGYFTSRPGARIHMIEEADPLLRRPEVRMTLDYPEDLEFFREVFERHAGPGEPSLRDAMRIIADHPELVTINASVQALYEENIRKATPVSMKA